MALMLLEFLVALMLSGLLAAAKEESMLPWVCVWVGYLQW